ncbi:hypothetical protein BDF22DRAFT_685165 [Syncephalis plumigaleata]|nr:hypothetical protein BDF22DRAFT_685165 [Syncephalis plumigaleata]
MFTQIKLAVVAAFTIIHGIKLANAIPGLKYTDPVYYEILDAPPPYLKDAEKIIFNGMYALGNRADRVYITCGANIRKSYLLDFTRKDIADPVKKRMSLPIGAFPSRTHRCYITLNRCDRTLKDLTKAPDYEQNGRQFHRDQLMQADSVTRYFTKDDWIVSIPPDDICLNKYSDGELIFLFGPNPSISRLERG